MMSESQWVNIVTLAGNVTLPKTSRRSMVGLKSSFRSMTELNIEIALDLSVPNNQQPAMKKH